MNPILADISDRVKPILKRYGIRRAKVFGSRVRGDNRPDSDLDVLIDYGDQKFSFLDHVALQQDMSDELGMVVDVVTESAVHPALKERITADARLIYEG